MNSFPINKCVGDKLKTMLFCPFDPRTNRVIHCIDCLYCPSEKRISNIPESKKKFLRDMIFSTGEFDE